MIKNLLNLNLDGLNLIYPPKMSVLQLLIVFGI